ncbi:LysR family transcriptional regulator [Companilactobacillus kimchiensis]|uniref:LysR family transcriptional regulator n=1 Tax=Companilactobacillus kimchiensis TaxID=993692 RepID=UPI00070C7DC9|nr:LysR family transcriptional regulator [Companilactobacillus kimchiensis]
MIVQMYLTFLRVAESGSFSKASKILFISPVSVMKQINALENQLGIKLLNRSPHGTSLTLAGQRLYTGISVILHESNDMLEQVKHIDNTEKAEIKVGASIMRPGTPLMNIWQKHNAALQSYKFRIVLFSDDDVTLDSPSTQLGTNLDCIVGPCDSQGWYDHYNVLKLGMDPFRLAIPQNHPLVDKKELTFTDLRGQTLVLPPRNASPVLDKMTTDLENNHSDINIIHTFNFYNTDVFNRYANSRDLLLTRDTWRNLNPLMKTVKVKWNYASPYGVIYSKSPSQKLQSFIQKIQTILLA